MKAMTAVAVRLMSILGLVGVMAAATPALAGEATPKDRIEAVYGQVKRAAATAATQEDLTNAVTTEFDGFIDYEAFSARTLKTTWPTLNATQKATFIDRFKRLVIRTYAKKFQPKTEFAVEYRGDVFTNDGKTDATVKTTVRGKKIAADVDYLVSLADVAGKKAWRAHDIIVDEVSMALNWRQQFEKIIAKEGFDSLIAKINKKIEKSE